MALITSLLRLQTFIIKKAGPVTDPAFSIIFVKIILVCKNPSTLLYG